jgi:alanine dehydrogenase
MIIGIPKEIKEEEYRVSIIPAGVRTLTAEGHRILVEKSAGQGSSISDKEYEKAGARIVGTTREIFDQAELILKVKEPLPGEYKLFREGQILFTFLHLASNPQLTSALMESGIVGIAYETVETEGGTLPLLIPMSEIAGKIAAQVGAYYLGKPQGGKGILVGGTPGVAPAQVVVIGGGTVGVCASQVAAGMGAKVTLLELKLDRIRFLEHIMPKNVTLIASNRYNIEKAVREADIVIGAVLIPGARAPKVLSREMVKQMRPGSVIVDVAIDQGGCIETSQATTHGNPTYKVYDVTHYCVTNMPGAFSYTSTFALANATLPYVLEIATKGYRRAIQENLSLLRGVNVVKGKLTYKPVAESQGLRYYPVQEVI